MKNTIDRKHNLDEVLHSIDQAGGHHNVLPISGGAFEASVILPDETVLVAEAANPKEALRLVARLWTETTGAKK